MCSVFSTVNYEVDWVLTHVGPQLYMKGMLWVLQQVIPTEVGQGRGGGMGMRCRSWSDKHCQSCDHACRALGQVVQTLSH